MDSSSSHLATNQASAGQCTVYIDDDDKPGSCVCGHKFNFHTSAAHLDPFASLPVHRTRSTNTGNTPARDGTSDDVDESQEEDRLAEVERRFKHARSKGTADAAGHASLAYHAPAAGSLRPRASHTEALKEARKGLGGGNKGKGKSVSTKNSRKVKVKAEKENGDGRKGKSQVSGPVKALRVREIYFLPSGLKYNRVRLAAGGSTYDAEIGVELYDWEEVIGIRLPQSVLGGRDIVDDLALRLRQEGLAAIAKDHPDYKADGFFAFDQSTQAEVDLFMRSLLPFGFSLLDEDLERDPPAGSEKKAKPPGALDWVVLKVTYNKISVTDHHSIIDVDFLRRCATTPAQATRECLFITPRRHVVLDPALRILDTSSQSDNVTNDVGNDSGDLSDSGEVGRADKGKGKAVASGSHNLRSGRKSPEVHVDFDDELSGGSDDDLYPDDLSAWFDNELRGDTGYSSGSDGMWLGVEDPVISDSCGVSPVGSTKRQRSISPTSTIDLSEETPQSSTAVRKRRREGTITARTLDASSRTLSQLTVEDDAGNSRPEPEAGPSNHRLARAESEDQRIDRIQDVWANLHTT